MRVKIEISEELPECEVTIRCRELDEDVLRLQRLLSQASSENVQMLFMQGDKECYLPLHRILFFETSGSSVDAHTKDDVFSAKYRLYELEEMLPSYFLRVSKSTILNTREVYSITRNLTAASLVEFSGTYKKVYVSRSYYKALKLLLDERVCGMERKEK